MARQLLVENLTMIWNDTTPLPAPQVNPDYTPDDDTILDLIGDANEEALVTESVTGFSTTPSQIETPDYIDLQVGKIPGSVTIDDASMEFYLSDTPALNILKTKLAVGDTGFISIIVTPTGSIVPGTDVADVWPATVQSKTLKFTGGNEAAKWILSVACGVPTYDVPIVAGP